MLHTLSNHLAIIAYAYSVFLSMNIKPHSTCSVMAIIPIWIPIYAETLYAQTTNRHQAKVRRREKPWIHVF